MKTEIVNPDSELETTLKQFRPDFKAGFEERIMNKIVNLKAQSFDQVFTRSFQKISLIGAAAVIALLVTILAIDGSLSTDSLIGINNIDMETATSMIISGF